MLSDKSIMALMLIAMLLVASRTTANGFDVEFSGCSHVLRDSRCVLSTKRTVNLWVNANINQPPSITLDKRTVVPDSTTPVDGGIAITITVPEGHKELTLVLGAFDWSMKFFEQTPPDIIDHSREAYRAGDFLKVITQLEAAIQSLPNDWRGMAYKMIGQAQRNRGETEIARQSLNAAIVADTVSNRYSDAIKSATVLAFMLLENGENPAQVRTLLHSLPAAPKGDARSAYDMSYFLGLTEFNAGNARGALEHLEKAAGHARRMQDYRRRSYAESQLAIQLQQIGRREQAAKLLAPWIESNQGVLSECQRAGHMVNYVWAQLLVLEGGGKTANPMFLATEVYELSKRCQRVDENNALANLALAKLHAGDTQGAEETLAKIDRNSESLTLRTILWLWDIKARVAIAQGNLAEAFKQYQTLAKIAEATLSPSARWRAAVGIAKVQAELGDQPAALRSYNQAEQFLSDDMFAIPLEAGRETLLTARHSAVVDHLMLLLEMGKENDAFELARRSRNRLMRSLAVTQKIHSLQANQKIQWETALSEYRAIRKELDNQIGNAWALPTDELEQLELRHKKLNVRLSTLADQAISAAQTPTSPLFLEPQPGEALFSFYPLKDGWVSFAQTSDDLEVVKVDCHEEEPNELASCLIRPFASTIKQSEVMRIFPVGVLKNVDFHALPIDDRQIIDFTAVIYDADIVPAPNDRQTHTTGVRSATIVADGTGDLAGARAELELVSDMLKASGEWTLTTYEGDQALRSTVRDAIKTADVFHFAGHARFKGKHGWTSELVLANDTSLTVADIITLEQVPKLIVLSGCETATTSEASLPDSIGLANAFLSAGSQHVLATSRIVNDETARKVISEFYTKWMQGTTAHESLRLAQRAVRQNSPDADWAAYRLIEQ